MGIPAGEKMTAAMNRLEPHPDLANEEIRSFPGTVKNPISFIGTLYAAGNDGTASVTDSKTISSYPE